FCLRSEKKATEKDARRKGERARRKGVRNKCHAVAENCCVSFLYTAAAVIPPIPRSRSCWTTTDATNTHTTPIITCAPLTYVLTPIHLCRSSCMTSAGIATHVKVPDTTFLEVSHDIRLFPREAADVAADGKQNA